MINYFRFLFHRYIFCAHDRTEWTTKYDLGCIDCERILRRGTDTV